MADGVHSFPIDGAASGRGPASGEAICPHCGHSNERGSRTILDCAGCDRSFALPKPPTVARRTVASGGFDPILARSPTDVGLRLTGSIGLGITVVFYLGVVGPLGGTYFGDLFAERGWVPYVISWLSAWAAVLLVVKTWLLSVQRRALELDLLPESLDSRITPRNADLFQQHLREAAAREFSRSNLPVAGGIALAATRSFLVERLERALERLRMRGSSEDVLDQLASQAQLDANAVESSYTMVRVFIWAIPLLGFIGTVVGISASVAGFSDSVAQAVDLEVMKQSISTVTTGLGVAFDTTLLALVMSILIMFPTSSLQKAEEDFLARVEAYCDEQLGRRLKDDGTNGADDRESRLEEQIERLARSIDALGARLGEDG